MEIADAFAAAFSVGFKFMCDFEDPLRGADWGTSDDSDVMTIDVADQSIAPLIEPVLNPRVEDLIRNRIPAVREHEFSGKRRS
jgi:hypothetical protein